MEDTCSALHFADETEKMNLYHCDEKKPTNGETTHTKRVKESECE